MLYNISLFIQHLGGIRVWVSASNLLPSTPTPVEAWGISQDKISFYSDAPLQSHSLSRSLTLSARGNMHFHVPARGVCSHPWCWCSLLL